jgi:glycosyl transferase family 25
MAPTPEPGIEPSVQGVAPLLTDVPAYLINLEGSDDRLTAARAHLGAVGLTFQRVPAFDGRKLRLSEFPDYDAAAAYAYMGRPLRGGEIGCYLSHLDCARRFLATGRPIGLVMEDDIRLMPAAAKVLPQIVAWLGTQPDDWDMVNLGPSKHKMFTPVQDFDAGGQSVAMTRAHYFPMSATAILWSRRGAQSFVSGHRRIFAPLDNYYRHWMTRTDRGLAVWPPIVGVTGVLSDIAPLTAGNRSSEGRHPLYGLIKQRRLLTYKALAWLHRAAYRRRR